MASAIFFNLSVHTQRRIDKAYLKLCESLPEHVHKKRKLDDGPTNDGAQQPVGQGGFIVEDKPGLGGGGFIVDDPPAGGGGFIVDDYSGNTPDDVELEDSQLPRVPLDLIPRGLKLLDLPPEDAQALAVFEQAASGWDDDQPKEPDEMEHKAVGLDDWRAVCGILLEPHDREYADSSEEESPRNRRTVRPNEDDDSDGYEEHASDEDYVDESFSRQRRRRTTRQSAAMDSSDEDEEMEDESNTEGARRLNKRQKETTLQDFANFFPDASSGELPDKKIMISDIQRVAKLLKEKIKAEDIVEMLEAFSTSADKSVSLSDFEQMMLAAKLA